MIFDLSVPTPLQIERSPDDTDFSDLTTASGARKTGSASWTEDGNLDIPFSPDPTPAEVWAIKRRLITSDASEEALYIAAEQAIQANAAWRAGTGTTIRTAAANIENRATADGSWSATVRDQSSRQEASGIRLLAEHLTTISQQNEAIIQLLLKLMNG